MTEELFILEGPYAMREGEIQQFTVTWSQFASISSATTEAYRGGSSESGTLLSGSDTVSGNVQTSQLLTVPSGWGGSTIVLEFRSSASSQVFKVGMTIDILTPGQEQ